MIQIEQMNAFPAHKNGGSNMSLVDVDDERTFKRYLLTECEYLYVRKLANGEWAGIAKQLFTCGLFVGLTENGYRTRFCYEKTFEAMDALEEWDGHGDPPGNWIKEKSLSTQRMNPNMNPNMKGT